MAKVVPRAEASPEQVRAAVSEVLDTTQYREAALQHARRLAATDAAGMACTLLEEF